ncbi:hypothetical protein ACFU6K_17440 [Kitasatospora sp. NPDC057512]|uniref:hypothetical protein n=1 Tax=Kitasatospora sp. NPDC057512 TaxID=3346154 RepID=UPI0036D00E31
MKLSRAGSRLSVLLLLAAGVVPATTSAHAVPRQTAPAVAASVEPGCSEEWSNYTEGNANRMKSRLCLEENEYGVRPVLYLECGMAAFAGSVFKDPPGGCQTWDPSRYTLTRPDGVESTREFPVTSGNARLTVRAEYTAFCTPGTWKLSGAYGVVMKDSIGQEADLFTHREATFEVTC